MRIDNAETRIFMGDFLQQNVYGADQEKKMFNFFQRNKEGQDKVDLKKQEARQKAMKLVKDVYEAEKTIDDDLEERAQRVEEAEGNILEAQKEIREIEKQKEELKKSYGITDECQEQKDLKLLEKRRDSMKIGFNIELTKEDKEQLARIDEQGMTEYQRQSLELDSYKAPFNKVIQDEQKVALEENIIIREIGLERLKSNPMTDAAAQAEEIMESANQEIIGMILEDGKETVDENMEEVKEDIDKAKEEQKQQEEQIEEIRQKNEAMEEQYQVRREENKKAQAELPEIPIDQILELDEIKTDVMQEVDNMLMEMKLLAEDLKGSVIDMDL